MFHIFLLYVDVHDNVFLGVTLSLQVSVTNTGVIIVKIDIWGGISLIYMCHKTLHKLLHLVQNRVKLC